MPLDADPQVSFASESASIAAAGAVRCTLTSEAAGWHSLLLVGREAPSNMEEFEWPPTPDQQLVLMTSGRCEFEGFNQGHWRSSHKRAGAASLAAPQHTYRLRSNSVEKESTIETLNLYIPPVYLAEAAEE